MGNSLQIGIAMGAYMLLIIGVGLYYNKRSNANSTEYFLGGRSLGPWFTAMSAEASDMSGWLLMGLPGVAYWCGLADAVWTAIGLGIGTYLNWLLIARRLRSYSVVAGNSITIPEFFSNRFRENKKVILLIASVFILVFFTVYASSCFVTCGKLFSALFNESYYKLFVLIGALFVLAYTFLGGFLAESASDFIQAIIMILALALVLIIGVSSAGGVSNVLDNARDIPGFLDFFGIASPETVNDVQQVAGGKPLFGDAGTYGFLTILSTLSWGLGYFGMPQVLLRFMAIKEPKRLGQSRRIAIIWCVISLCAAVAIGIIGRYLYPTELLTSSSSENVFILLSTKLLPPLAAGIVMSGILAATMSSSDSYLLIASSAVSKDIFRAFRKNATDKQVMLLSKVTLVIVAAIGAVIALDEDSIIFMIVSFAWAGFGATFGPAMIFSLFWKRVNRAGVTAGMLVGGATVFIWKLAIRPLGGALNIYELLPAFVLSCIAIVIVSLLTARPSAELEQDFEAAKAAAK